jgi:hypothetical protein
MRVIYLDVTLRTAKFYFYSVQIVFLFHFNTLLGLYDGNDLLSPLCLQDTVTGFLLAGVGNVDLRKKTNYLIVDNSNSLNLLICKVF